MLNGPHVSAFDRTVELNQAAYEGTVVQVNACVDANGDLIVSAHGIAATSPASERLHVNDHWVVVGEENKDLVLLGLLKERFMSALTPTAEFLEWLEEHGVRYEVASSAGEHRGPARLSAKARRRNGIGRAKPTRAGP